MTLSSTQRAMKIPPAHTFPPSSGSPQSLVKLQAKSLAENGRLTKLLGELRQEKLALRQEIAALKQENFALQERLNRNSTNSNQPPSRDSSFGPPEKPADLASQAAKAGARPVAKKSRPYHKSVRQPLLRSDTIVPCPPGPCSGSCLLVRSWAGVFQVGELSFGSWSGVGEQPCRAKFEAWNCAAQAQHRHVKRGGEALDRASVVGVSVLPFAEAVFF